VRASKSNSDPISQRAIHKFAERREELAQAALQTLSELGYARTSLREIAQNSDFSHGVLHYYFADKVDLIMYCVKRYKAACVKRYDEIVASAKTAEALRRGFAAGMAETLRADATLHRLWYDLRTQSLFEASFRDDVTEIDRSLERMIWRIVTQYATLAKRELQLTSPLAYAIFDGLFQRALAKQLANDAHASRELGAQVETVLAELVLQPRSSRRSQPRALPKRRATRAKRSR
jgi:AcrR family transcriptional regulator